MKTIKEFVADHLEYIKCIFKGKQTKTQILEKVDIEIDEFFDGLKSLFKTVVRQVKKDDIEGFVSSSFKTIGGVVPSKVKDEKLKKAGFKFDCGPIHINIGKDKKRPPVIVVPGPTPPPHHHGHGHVVPPPPHHHGHGHPKPRPIVVRDDTKCDSCDSKKTKKK